MRKLKKDLNAEATEAQDTKTYENMYSFSCALEKFDKRSFVKNR